MGLRVIEVKVIIIIIVVFGLFLNRTVSIRLRHCKVLTLLLRCSLLLATTLSTLSEPKFDTAVPDR